MGSNGGSSPKLRGAPLAALALIACILTAAGPAGAAGKKRVAVLPIVIHTLDDQTYLREGLADMLAARLGRSPALAVLRVDDAAQATTDSDRAREAAKALGADFVLFGSFTRFGDGASLDVHCAPVRGGAADTTRVVFIQSGSLGEIIPQLDGLADRIARYVARGERPALPSVASSTTEGSPAADQLAEALSELDALRERVGQLEQTLYDGGGVAARPDPLPSETIAPGAEQRPRLR